MAEFMIEESLLREAGVGPDQSRPRQTGLRQFLAAIGWGVRRNRRQSGVVYARWLAEDGETALGEDFAPPAVRQVTAEAFRPSGQIEHVDILSGAEFSADPPQGARFLQIRGSAGRQVVAPLAALRSDDPMPPVQPEPFGSDQARFRFPVFAERFVDRNAFLAAAESLHRWILQVPPFTLEEVRNAFVIDAYFWPSPGPNGHFNTPDIIYDCANPPASAVTFSGDNSLAKRRLSRLMLDRRFGLVLINSAVRGGAGGIAGHGYPAWTSITACPFEDWQAVALHEVGHALGLADEYLDPQLAAQQGRGEPNCATSANLATLEWRNQCTEQPPTVASIFAHGQQPPAAPDFVGLFQGARYRADYYRPSNQCLMRYTNVHRFCEVCARHIRQRITTYGE